MSVEAVASSDEKRINVSIPPARDDGSDGGEPNGETEAVEPAETGRTQDQRRRDRDGIQPKKWFASSTTHRVVQAEGVSCDIDEERRRPRKSFDLPVRSTGGEEREDSVLRRQMLGSYPPAVRRLIAP